METEVLLMPKVNDNYTHTEDYTTPSDSEDESKDINSLAMEENKREFQSSSGNTSEVECDKKEPPDLTYSSENVLPKVLSPIEFNNNRAGRQCNETEIIDGSTFKEAQGNAENIPYQTQQTVVSDTKENDTCFSLDSSKSSTPNSGRLQDYRLNFEGTSLEAVPEDATIPQSTTLSEHCTGIEANDRALLPTVDPPRPIEKLATEMDVYNETKMQETLAETSATPASYSYDAKKQDRPTFHIPESNASDVSECSIATNATTNSHMENPFLSHVITKTEALTARQQVALWLTRTSMSDLSSMPSLKNLVHPPSVTAKEPPSRSSQSSHCSCYYHHHHHTQNMNSSMRSNAGSSTAGVGNCRPLSTAISDCCFDAACGAKPAQCGNNLHLSTSPNKVKLDDTNSPRTTKPSTIRRNYSTKSLIGGFSFSFSRGVGSEKNFKDDKRNEDPCGERESLMPSPIRKCETVIALSGVDPESPSGPDGAVDQSTAYPNVTSTVIKRRHDHHHYQHFHNHPSSHSCSVSNVRVSCGHGNTSPSDNATPHTSKRSTSLSLFKKLSTSASKEKSFSRAHKCNNHQKKNHSHSNSKHSAAMNPCEVQIASNVASSICESPHQGIRPINRHRSNASMICSRCTSAFSMNPSRMTSRATSQMSLLQMASISRRLSTTGSSVAGYSVIVNPVANSGDCDFTSKETIFPEILCKICLVEYPARDIIKLHDCGCSFCCECMIRYATMEVMEGAYEISCPDSECEKPDGKLQMSEIEHLVGNELTEKHKTFRLNTEVALDANRAWCPQAGCDTICHICRSLDNNLGANQKTPGPIAVNCPTCSKEFCSICSANWHPGLTCAQNGNALFASASNTKKAKSNGGLTKTDSTSSNVRIMGAAGDILILGGGGTGAVEGDIKRCPMCQVPIERDAGCAQMMCKRCKHVFCWFCLTSLDEDFLLRHYDSGECKGLLGHTRASVLWHRAQVIGIFAGFGILLLIASPLLLMAAPCIFCCNCKSCQKLDGDNGDPEGAANEISIAAGDPMGKDDNGVFGRFSSANFRIGGTVRKDSEDFVASATSPLPQSASARFSTTGTPPPSFTAET